MESILDLTVPEVELIQKAMIARLKAQNPKTGNTTSSYTAPGEAPSPYDSVTPEKTSVDDVFKIFADHVG